MEVKVVCGCGQKYKFDVEPRDGRMPAKVACPVCGADGTETADSYLAQQVVASPPIPVALRVRSVGHAAPAVAVATAPAASSEVAAEPQPVVFEGSRFCTFHPKNIARLFCAACNRAYCEMCVEITEVGGRSSRTCRGCGAELAAVQYRPAPTKSFYSKLAGAFAYPFQGAGIVILVCATVAFSAVYFITAGIIGFLFRILLYGFVFLFMQNIIQTTTTNEKEELAFPEASGLFGAAFQLAGTVMAAFWLTIGLEIMKLSGMGVPPEAIIASVILGGIYFPMALLVVAMKDTVLAANPLVVIPAMSKAPLKYSITALLTLFVFGLRQLGNILSGGAGHVSLRTHKMNVFFVAVGIQAILALLSVYLLTVTMRILGLFYNDTKRQLGWFNV